MSEATFPNPSTQFQPGNPGRPVGSLIGRERRKQLRRAAAQAVAVRDVVPAFGGDALALFQHIYRDETQPIEMRLVAARAAASFERPTLQATAVAVTKEDEARQALLKAPPSVRLAHLQALAGEIGLTVTGKLHDAEHERTLWGTAIETPPLPAPQKPADAGVQTPAEPSSDRSASQELRQRIADVEKLSGGVDMTDMRSRLARLRHSMEPT